MKLTDLWNRLEETFGPGYAASVARDQVFTQLGGRTINEALAGHVEVHTIWRAVVAAYPDRVPARLH
jgi:Protein of unknown function (DUF3046)